MAQSDLPDVRVPLPGPRSRRALAALAHQAPMGPPSSGDGTIVLSSGRGATVTDLDGNRFVDLAAGFGALLLGHARPEVASAVAEQAGRLTQALGDVFPSDTKLALLERLARLYPEPGAQVILGQSGADAVTAALKSAVLATGRSGLIAFGASYHGLSYGALAVTDLRSGYRAPFEPHLPRDVRFVPYPDSPESAEHSLAAASELLSKRDVAAVVVEPILGRGGVVVPPAGFLRTLAGEARRWGSLLIADEVWTGLGRAGEWLLSSRAGVTPDLVCLGKGLGGGIPISACIGRADVMAAWQRPEEVVHTATFAGAPLAARAALVTLDLLESENLIERSRHVGARFLAELEQRLQPWPGHRARGVGLMIGIDVPSGKAGALMRRLLEKGFLTSTGGGRRDVLVLTPPLTIEAHQLDAFLTALEVCLAEGPSEEPSP